MDKTVYKTACHICHGSCIAEVTVEDGRVSDIRLDPDGIMSKGRMCPKGLFSKELIYHPDRLLHPMKRVGERGEKAFNTPSGKVELYSHMMEEFGFDPLPFYAEPPESPVSRPDLTEKYPLVLTTGTRINAFFVSEQRQVPSLRKMNPWPLATLHPDTAAHSAERGVRPQAGVSEANRAQRGF